MRALDSGAMCALAAREHHHRHRFTVTAGSIQKSRPLEPKHQAQLPMRHGRILSEHLNDESGGGERERDEDDEQREHPADDDGELDVFVVR